MTVTTDKADYAPGSTATFIVAGVNSGSSVTFQIADLASDPGIDGIADVYVAVQRHRRRAGRCRRPRQRHRRRSMASPRPMAAPPAPRCRSLPPPATRPRSRRSATRPIKSSTENLKAGTPQSVWAIHGSIANQGDSQIEGFATQISANAGQTVSFKIDTASSGYNARYLPAWLLWRQRRAPRHDHAPQWSD